MPKHCLPAPKSCGACGKMKGDFTERAWRTADARNRVCVACMSKVRAAAGVLGHKGRLPKEAENALLSTSFHGPQRSPVLTRKTGGTTPHRAGGWTVHFDSPADTAGKSILSPDQEEGGDGAARGILDDSIEDLAGQVTHGRGVDGGKSRWWTNLDGLRRLRATNKITGPMGLHDLKQHDVTDVQRFRCVLAPLSNLAVAKDSEDVQDILYSEEDAGPETIQAGGAREQGGAGPEGGASEEQQTNGNRRRSTVNQLARELVDALPMLGRQLAVLCSVLTQGRHCVAKKMEKEAQRRLQVAGEDGGGEGVERSWPIDIGIIRRS